MATRDNDSLSSDPDIKKPGVDIQLTAEQFQEYMKCIQDPMYFIKNYVKILTIDRGVIPFPVWDFQERMIVNFHESRFSIAKMPRQVGKTTCAVSYLLWCILFNEDYKIAILANKHKMAQEIVSRLKAAYRLIPKWMQQGVVVWNKTDLELENGAKIVSSATGGSAGRGDTFNLVYLDEFAFVPSAVAEEFYTSIYPTITSGATSKLMITSTPNGMNMFHKFWKDSENKKNSFKRVDVHWSDVPGRTDEWRIETIMNTSERQFQQEFECEFLGSSMTLIDGRKIAQIPTIPAIHETRDGFSFYEHVDREHTYVMVVDTARGTGLDYSAFIVFDTSTVPFKVVCTFRNNNVHTIVFPKYIMEAAVYFNSCYILVETNDLGQQIVDILKEDLEYDGLISTASKKARYEATSGFGIQSQTGVRTTKTVKRLGCSTFKSMVESDSLLINDHNLLEEMSKFVYNGKGSYEAENGHDDLVMCGVLFAWLTTQPYFKELTNTDLVRSIYRIGTEDMDDMMVPFGHIDDGRGTLGTSDGIDYWTSD